MTKRIPCIDGIRGLCAVLVMLYHYQTWSFPVTTASLSAIMTFFGLYCVEIFYIVSGFSLAYVYQNTNLLNFSNWKTFIIKRYCRLAPLFIFLCIITLITLKPHQLMSIPLWKLALNFSVLFGFFQPSLSLLVAGWSIGVEIVFYSLLPFILYTRAAQRHWWMIISAIFIVLFAFIESSSVSETAQSWKIYSNPLNHLLFFTFGVCAEQWWKEGKYAVKNPQFFWLVSLGVILFVGVLFVDPVSLQIQWCRVILSGYSCYLFWVLLNRQSTALSASFFVYLGNISYSLYLIHPIIYFRVVSQIPSLWIRNLLGISLVLVLSTLSYRYLEIPFMNLGRKQRLALSPS